MSDISSVGFSRRRAATAGTGGGGNVDALVRTQRRMDLLQTYGNEFVTSSPAGAIGLAESPASDDEILKAATESVGFANVNRIRDDLGKESTEVQRTIWSNLPKQIQQALGQVGYTAPSERKEGSGGRLFGSIPVVGEISKRVLDWGTIPGVGGALEEAQHFVGEGLEPVGGGLKTALNVAAWPQEQVSHLYRGTVYAREEGQVDKSGWGIFTGGWSPSEIGAAWNATDEDDGYVRNEYEEKARKLLDGSDESYRLAHATAMHQPLEKIIADFGLEPGSVEATQLVQRYQQIAGTPEFNEAVNDISSGFVSFGRIMAQELFGIDDTEHGFGRYVSGLIDAGFVTGTDPLLIAGKASKAYRFGRDAFRLEAGATKARRQADLALTALRAREGMDVGEIAGDLGRVTSHDMRLGRNILAWSDRVAEGFRTGKIAKMSRDLPNIGTAWSHLSDFHIRQLAQGREGLDSTLGVIKYLQDRESLLMLMGSRVGGSSPMTWGLRMPTLTQADRLRIAAKDYWTRAIDWSRFVGATPEQFYGPKMREVIAEVGSPRSLARQSARWLGSRTVGATGRTMSLLTHHTPYTGTLSLSGVKALPEFERLANTGLFAGMSQGTMDEFVDAFAKGDIVTRAKVEHAFLEELFRKGGIQDTPFAQRFLQAHGNAYAIDPMSGGQRLVDVGHADALAIPDIRGYLTGTYRLNHARYLFHSPLPTSADALLGRYWKPSVLLRIGFIGRAAGEEMLHLILKHGPRSYLGAMGAGWAANAAKAEELRGALQIAEAAGQADKINVLRSALADVEGSMWVAPVRSLMAGTDRMVSTLLATTKEGASEWRRNLATKVERFAPDSANRSISGLEHFADEMSLWTSGVVGRLSRAAPGELTKARVGQIMAEHWNPATAAAAREMLYNDVVQRYFAEEISGATMTPWEMRSIRDADGVPVEKVQMAEFRQGQPLVQEVELRAMPGDVKSLDRVLDDPTFHRTLYTRHQYTRRDRVERAIVDNVLPRFVGEWGPDLGARMGYSDDLAAMRDELNTAWSHNWSTEAKARLDTLDEAARRNTAFDSGPDALNFMRRYLDGEIDEAIPQGWIGSRLKDLFDDAGTSLSGGKFLNILNDPDVPAAAKRWMLYDQVDGGRLLDNTESLQRAMRNTARGRLARPDMQPALRSSRLYAKGESLARPTQDGISKVYVPLMPPTYQATDLGDDFVEAAAQRIVKIGGYSPEEARTIAQNVAAGSVGDDLTTASRIGMVPLSSWAASDPRVTDAVMGAIEDVTGQRATFGIMEVPDDVIERSTDQVLAQGLRRDPGATDFYVDGWRLATTRPTTQPRRYVTLDIGGEAWDSGVLDDAQRAFEANPADGTHRVYSTDRVNWDAEPPSEGPFYFADVPTTEAAPSFRGELESHGVDYLRRHAQILGIKGYSRMKKADLIDALLAKPEMRQVLTGTGAREVATSAIPDEVVADARRMPGQPGTWAIDERSVSDGLGEIDALEAAADRTVDEITEILTTLRNPQVGDDVLHEIVEPLKRGDRYITTPEGVEEFHPGYHFDHLVKHTKGDRLPATSYGPNMVAGRDIVWSNFVREWFDGPVNAAVSSLVRNKMFLNVFGEQLRNVRPMADLLVDPAVRDAAARAMGTSDLDDIVRGIVKDYDFAGKTRFVDDEEIAAIVKDHGLGDMDDFTDLKRYATQHHHALNLARENALNRTAQLIVPFIDDHRIRSAFQNYVGNFIPFLFAEEQFLKRWARSVIESPEMIRRAQLGMNGLRAMGTVRRDDQGNEVFVYPMVGDVAEMIAKPLEWISGGRISLPYDVQMTGDVGYTLPGFGNQMGQPSAGPLVGLGVEMLSRQFPELSEVEGVVIGRGANRPVWQYIVPTGAANIFNAAYGDIDKGQLASATIQAVQTMAINGQLPPETATPEERQEFIDRAQNQARYLLMVRGIFGLTAPSSPSVRFEHDDLTEEFRDLLQADVPFEESIRLFLANHPDESPAQLLAATVSQTETEFSGLDMPTDKAFDWVNRNKDLVEAYPAAAAWLAPRADSDDTFSQRAFDQQLSMGLRTRKQPKDFIDDVYFRTAAQDYFDARQQTEAARTGKTGATLQQIDREWRVWKDAYFQQHPLFAVMLQDPERQQKRSQAIDQLIALSGRDDDIVSPELKEMMTRFEDYRTEIAALRGDRRRAVSNRRSALVGETAAWMQWFIAKHPTLAAPYLRLIEPELREADEDAVMQVVD